MKASLLRSLSPRDRRALAWGGGIAALALVFAFGVKPYVRTLRETRDELTMQRGLLARERALVAGSVGLPATLEKSRTALTEQSTPLFDGIDDLSATSNLSDYVSRAALSNQVLVQALETRNAQPLEEGMTAVAVDFRAESDFEGVLRFLHSLEEGPELVRVSALTLQRLDRPVAPGVPDTEVLAISGTMTGYTVFSGDTQ
jgi:type II secretory pathway component PulM